LSHFEEAISEVVVLALFVPLCISTGGNSGSQAATLITRSLALGQVTLRDWGRVLRHELVMGVILGVTLGLIGFVRGAFTPEDTRGSEVKRKETFEVRIPKDGMSEVQRLGDRINFPKGVVQSSVFDRNTQVILPEGEDVVIDDQSEAGYRIYHFP